MPTNDDIRAMADRLTADHALYLMMNAPPKETETLTGKAAAMLRELLAEREWRDMDSAPRDGTQIIVWAAPMHGLPGFVTLAAYHPDAGWCVDELREATKWLPLPTPETGE